MWVGRPLAPVPPEFRPSFRFDRVWDRWGFGAGVRHRRRPLLGLSHHRWSRVLVPGTAREAKERAVLGSRDHPFRAPDGGPARGRDRDRALRAALPPRGCATGETGDRRGNADGMAHDRRRPVARVHLLLAGVGGARPAAGLAAGPATARALPAVVDCQAKTRITGCSC